MKRKLITLTAACALSLGALVVVNAEDPTDEGPAEHRHGEMGRHHGGISLDKLNETLNLTAEQKAKVQPIVDQAKPQIRAIHEEAMQKAKTIMDNTMTQIRPLLTPEQQQKLDAMQKTRKGMHKAHREMPEQ